jgi:hypothetical protein
MEGTALWTFGFSLKAGTEVPPDDEELLRPVPPFDRCLVPPCALRRGAHGPPVDPGVLPAPFDVT